MLLHLLLLLLLHHHLLLHLLSQFLLHFLVLHCPINLPNLPPSFATNVKIPSKTLVWRRWAKCGIPNASCVNVALCWLRLDSWRLVGELGVVFVLKNISNTSNNDKNHNNLNLQFNLNLQLNLQLNLKLLLQLNLFHLPLKLNVLPFLLQHNPLLLQHNQLLLRYNPLLNLLPLLLLLRLPHPLRCPWRVRGAINRSSKDNAP